MGDNSRIRITTGSRDAFSGQLNRPPAGSSGAVGGLVFTSGGLHMGDRLQEGGQEEMIVVETGFNIGRSKEKS